MVIPIIPKIREKQNQTINALEKLSRAKNQKARKQKVDLNWRVISLWKANIQ